MTANVERGITFYRLLAATTRSPEIPESADVYGWLCGSWDLEVLPLSRDRRRRARSEGRSPRRTRARRTRRSRRAGSCRDTRTRGAHLDDAMNMYGTTLRSWDGSIQAWRIAWTNPASGHREEQIGGWSGTDILQEGMRPDGTKTRWTFTEITGDAFHWRGEALHPAKSTWTLEGEFLATAEAIMSTSAMNHTAGGVETRILREGFGEGAWHGPDLKAALADVTSEEAFLATRPGAPQHRRDRPAPRLLRARRSCEAHRHRRGTIRSRGRRLVRPLGSVRIAVDQGFADRRARTATARGMRRRPRTSPRGIAGDRI